MEDIFASFFNTEMINAHIYFSHISHIDSTHTFLKCQGINAVGLVSAWQQKPTLTENGNAALMAYKSKYPETTYIYGRIDYRTLSENASEISQNLQRQAEVLSLIGFDGVHIVEQQSMPADENFLPFDASEFEAFWKKIEQEQLPVVWERAILHAGADKQPGEDATTNVSKHDAVDVEVPLYTQAEQVLAKFPKLRIIFSHFNGMSNDLPRLTALLKAYPQVCLNLAPETDMFVALGANRDKTIEFFNRYHKRIMYGDGSGIKEHGIDAEGMNAKNIFMRRFLETEDELSMPVDDADFVHHAGMCKGLGLSEEVLRTIYGATYRRVAGAHPQPLNRVTALGECERMLTIAQKLVLTDEEKSILDAIDILVAS